MTDPELADSVSGIVADNSPSIRLAVLGDSDSHSYADKIWFSEGGTFRGGKYRNQTLQWTEVLEEFRGTEVEQGQWGTWGTWGRVARFAGLFGIRLRTPRKQDYEYNFATSGALCFNLMADESNQTQHLLRLVSRDETGWKKGIVLIRIGINDLGRQGFLDRAAADGLSETVLAAINACGKAIETSVRIIGQQQPGLYIVLVGILNNSDWPPYFEHWQSSTAQANIHSALDLFDERLRKLAAEADHVEFFDDRSNFRGYFGGRDSDGKPDYHKVELERGIFITNSLGNSPEHAILKDGHGGTLLNALWSRDFIDFINVKWALGITPVSDQEIIELAKGMNR